MARRLPLHKRVKAHCEAAGFSAHDIERKTGWHELRVWRLFAGKTRLTADDIEVIARAIGKTPGELYLDPRESAAAS